MDLEVRVPATVANLGPGFDCLGVAVGIHLHVKVTLTDKPETAGGGPDLPASEDLTHRSIVAAFEEVGASVPNLGVETIETFPVARGLGASGAAIAAGLVVAKQAGHLNLDAGDLARIATRIEGHSDNVLPALFGGLVLSSRGAWMRFRPVEEISPLLLIAGGSQQTSESRAVLPSEVPRADAVANTSAAAALVGILSGRESADALMWATEDRVHEPYRLPLMPATMDIHQSLRAKGIACALSGSGPSLICLVETAKLADTADVARDSVPEGWSVSAPGWELQGAQIR